MTKSTEKTSEGRPSPYLPGDAAKRHMPRPGAIGSFLLAALSVSALIFPIPTAIGGPDDLTVVRVEEDWVLTVNEPDNERAAPQVATQMAPAPDSPYYCIFQINHRELSQFVTGGLQVQIWYGDSNKGYKSYGSAALATTNETVTWTQRLEKNADGYRLKFSIVAGSSFTWGNLADAGLSVKCNAIDVSPQDISLDNYDPGYSVSNSGITFGANRVYLLQLVQVRKYRKNGSVEVDVTPRTVYQASGL